MKKKSYPSCLKRIGTVLSTLIFSFCLGLVVFYNMAHLCVGYKYYEKQGEDLIQIGVAQQENLVDRVIEEHLQELKNNGYTVVSSTSDNEIIAKKTIIRESNIKEELIQEINDNLNFTISAVKLTINDKKDVYYFKTKDECEKFIGDLNSYIQQNYTIEDNVNEQYNIITSNEVLDGKLAEVKQEKAEIDAIEEEKRIAAEAEHRRQLEITASRGTTRRSSGGAPLATYSYISTYYSSWHTGVDYAAPYNTAIYSWKDGTVIFAGWDNSGYGNFIQIRHNDGTISRYAHCNSIAVGYGQYVSRGQVIGYVGSTR